MSDTSGLDVGQKLYIGCHILTIEGQLDHETLPAFTAALDAAITDNRRPHVIVDLTHVGTPDSATLSVMLKAKQFANSVSRRLWYLIEPGGPADRLLTNAHLLSHLGVVYEVDQYGPKPRTVDARAADGRFSHRCVAVARPPLEEEPRIADGELTHQS